MQFLQDDLLCRLRGDPAELLGDKLLVHEVARLVTLFDLLGFGEGDLLFGVGHFLHGRADRVVLDAVFLGADADVHVARADVVLLFIRRNERVAERLDEDLFADPLFRFQIRQSLKELFANHCPLLDVFDDMNGAAYSKSIACDILTICERLSLNSSSPLRTVTLPASGLYASRTASNIFSPRSGAYSLISTRLPMFFR